MGRPPYLTPEQREASRIRQNKLSSKRALARRTAMRAAKAIAEGREPGKAGKPRVLTDEQRIANREETIRKHRERNLERIRKRDADFRRKERAERAIAEGRPVGLIGRIRQFTDEERREKARKSSLRYWERYPHKRRELYEKYYAEHKDEHTVRSRNRRARKKGNGGKHGVKDIRALWDKQRGICPFCGLPLDEKFHVDHWIPIKRGGSNGPENLRLLHGLCNRRKAAKMPSDFGLPDHWPP